MGDPFCPLGRQALLREPFWWLKSDGNVGRSANRSAGSDLLLHSMLVSIPICLHSVV